MNLWLVIGAAFGTATLYCVAGVVGASMKSIPLADCTRRLGAPPNWNHETDGICHTLEICDRDGFMISAWQPTDAGRARIGHGAPIFLHIQGQSHPVVALSVGGDS